MHQLLRLNLRDLGGLPTSDGRYTRAGLLFRSGALDDLSESQLAGIAQIGLRACCDLRSSMERERHPSRWSPECMPRVLELAVDVDVRVLDLASIEALRRSPDLGAALALMRRLYAGLPSACIPVLGRLFELLCADEQPLPLLIHCTAGKDRTGFVVAMLLHALGVEPDAIRADYLRTNELIDRERLDAKARVLLQALLGAPPIPELVTALNAARADYLEAALAQIRRDHGSVESYLLAAGLTDINRRRLQAALLH